MGQNLCKLPNELFDCLKAAFMPASLTTKKHKDEYESNFLLDLDYEDNDDEERAIILN
jgi:hypothetical protein